jgi:hypothetical protein
MLYPTEVITDQSSVVGQSVGTATSSILRGTIYTQLTTQMNVDMGKMESRINNSMASTIQAQLAQFFGSTQQAGTIQATTTNAPINQVSPTQAASLGDVPLSTEGPDEGPSAP